ncbi:MAG: NAD(P)-dependent alcohol dehydrogenase [Rhizobiaceae bacterium]
MRAAVATAYGPPDVVRIVEMPKPVPGPGEMLVRIHAASVSSGDWRLRSGVVPTGFGLLIRLALGFRRLRQPILGNDYSGVVEAVGEGVARFRPGDAVFGSAGGKSGCHADYRVVAENGPVAPKPPGLSHREAAALPFGVQTALVYLRAMGGLKSGESVLVIGASGAVGVGAVQIAHALGARVTGVCSSRNARLVREIGADSVIEYDRADPLAGEARYDMIVDTVGDARIPALRRLARDGGRILLLAAGLPGMARAAIGNLFGRRRLITGEAKESRQAMQEVADMAGSGAIRPVIDSVFAFDDIVRAHARVDTRHKVGAVIVEMVGQG